MAPIILPKVKKIKKGTKYANCELHQSFERIKCVWKFTSKTFQNGNKIYIHI